MNKFRFYFLLIFSVFIFSCNKSDSSSEVPIRDFAVQYASDIAMIEDFLNTHHLEPNNTSGYDDQDVTFTKITEGSSDESIMSWLNRDAYPKLLVKEVDLDNITYKIYYVKLREDNPQGFAPTRVDKAKIAYKGVYLYYDEDNNDALTTKQFEYNPYPDNFFVLNAVIRAWTEIIPLFKTGDKIVQEGQPTLYSQFGAGVVFVPSGLGYYNLSQENIPSYSPLIFNFKLYDIVRSDQDGDGVLSIYEDINGNGIFTDDDTDGDGIYDYLDQDDDNDGYYTRTEIKRPTSETGGYTIYYDYNGAAEDNPNTPYDERKGIPDCSGDFTTPTRIRKYLDSSCH